jgi:glucose/arabinose dehydrogenase
MNISIPLSPRRRVALIAAAIARALIAAADPAAAQICGDADRNGAVSVADGVRALRAAADLGGCETALCDLDGDGVITVRDGVNVLRLAAALPAFTACPIVPTLVLTPIATGLTAPVFVSGAPGDATRLFVVEQPGRILIVENGEVLTTPFLDITALTIQDAEQGLLGLAFHPGYASNRRFYVHYGDLRGDITIAEFLRSADSPTRAEPTPTRILRTVKHPFGNHIGGMVAFGPDGFLYVALGDGADPRNGQDTQSKLGKIIRLDVDSDVPPPGNFPGADPDVWNFGLRNPFRLSFDRATGDLYIADVGEDRFEEVDVEPRAQGGRNYGWDVTEGFECFEPSSGCDATGITLPVVAYAHQNGGTVDDCSVTGGYVYRGTAIPALVGRYLYGDLCSGRVRSFVWNGSAAVSELELTEALASSATVRALVSFGEDLKGELYIADLSGTVFRIDPRP